MNLATKRFLSASQFKAHKFSNNDIHLLNHFLLTGFLNLSEVRSLFPEIKRENIYYQIRRLVSLELIEPINDSTRGILGWRLSKKSAKIIAVICGLKGSGQFRLNHSQAKHDDILRAIAQVFNRDLVLEWMAHEALLRAHVATTQAHIRRKYRVIPDLLFQTKIENTSIRCMVELECNKKSSTRQIERLAQRLTSKEWNLVIFFLSEGVPIEPLIEIERQLPRKNPTVILSERRNLMLYIKTADFLKFGIHAKALAIKGEAKLSDILLKLQKNHYTGV